MAGAKLPAKLPAVTQKRRTGAAQSCRRGCRLQPKKGVAVGDRVGGCGAGAVARPGKKPSDSVGLRSALAG